MPLQTSRPVCKAFPHSYLRKFRTAKPALKINFGRVIAHFRDQMSKVCVFEGGSLSGLFETAERLGFRKATPLPTNLIMAALSRSPIQTA
jgi:hypothetical protein